MKLLFPTVSQGEGVSGRVCVVCEWEASLRLSVDVVKPCRVSTLGLKIAYLLKEEGFVFFWRGRLLCDNEVVPEVLQDSREIWVARRPKKNENEVNGSSSSDKSDDLEKFAGKILKERGQQDLSLERFRREKKRSHKREKAVGVVEAALKKSSFLSSEDLTRLLEEGYGDVGAFGNLTDLTLASSPFYFPKGLRRRILELEVAKEKNSSLETGEGPTPLREKKHVAFLIERISNADDFIDDLDVPTRHATKKYPVVYCCQAHADLCSQNNSWLSQDWNRRTTTTAEQKITDQRRH